MSRLKDLGKDHVNQGDEELCGDIISCPWSSKDSLMKELE